MSNILIVDDEQSIGWGLGQLCGGLGHTPHVAASAEEGLELAAQQPLDLLVLDVRLPGIDGLTAMDQFRRLLPTAPIIVITAFGDLATAVQAVQQGAFEYLLKPFDLAEIRAAITRALKAGQATGEVAAPRDDEWMLGESAAMQTAFKRIALAANADVGVLLMGESGVGKELAARAIHRHSSRSDRSFVAVNIAALSPTLAEAELFGHRAGAFTGAAASRNGLLVEADGGTLFLDEIAEVPLPLQAKLLRALDRGEVLPLGADQPVATNFRIIAATHQNLRERVESGDFRRDLYFRLSSFEITLPALRQRPEDIVLLARHFVRRFGRGNSVLAEATERELQRRPWHGNVRELRNAIEHALVVAPTGVVLPDHLPPVPSEPGAAAGGTSELSAVAERRAERLLGDPDCQGQVYEQLLREVEQPLLASAMRQYDNECAPAARALGLHRTTLRKKLDQYQLPASPDE